MKRCAKGRKDPALFNSFSSAARLKNWGNNWHKYVQARAVPLSFSFTERFSRLRRRKVQVLRIMSPSLTRAPRPRAPSGSWRPAGRAAPGCRSVKCC
jgi:hypothetical protein